MKRLGADDERRPPIRPGEIGVGGTSTTTTCPRLQVVVEGVIFPGPGFTQSCVRQLLPIERLEIALGDRLNQRLRLSVVRDDNRLAPSPGAGEIPEELIVDLGHRCESHVVSLFWPRVWPEYLIPATQPLTAFIGSRTITGRRAF